MKAIWRVVAAMCCICAAALAQEYGKPLGDLQAVDIVVTEQGLVLAVQQETAGVMTNAVEEGYLCTVQTATQIAGQRVSQAQLNSAVQGIQNLMAPLAHTQLVYTVTGPVIDTLAAHTGNEQIHLTLGQAALIAGAVQKEADPEAMPILTGHVNNAEIHLTPEQAELIEGALQAEKDYKALCAWHYGSADIEPSPGKWFDVSIHGVITKFLDGEGRENVVIPWEIDGVTIREIGDGAFAGDYGESIICGVQTLIAPRTVTKIGNNAFDTSEISKIVLPAVTYISARAFSRTENLWHINLPAVTNMAAGVFDDKVFETITFGAREALPEVNNFEGTPPQIIVADPKSTGWGETWSGAPVVRPALHAGEFWQPGGRFVTTGELAAAVGPLAITRELALRVYHYGSADIEPSPEDWFVFDPASGIIEGFDFENETQENIVVPWEIYGTPITAIGETAFAARSPEVWEETVITVILPKSVTRIGDYAFKDSRLRNIVAPGVTEIREGAFATYSPHLKLRLTLPTVTNIHYNAFVGNDGGKVASITFSGDALPEIEPFTAPDIPEIIVSNPQATGWGETWSGAPVVRPALHAGEFWQPGGRFVTTGELAAALAPLATQYDITAALSAYHPPEPAWIMVTNTAASVEIPTQGRRPIHWVGQGDATLTLSGLSPGVPLYLVAQGMSSLTIPGAYYVGGATWQTNLANHMLVWQYGAEILVTPITTTEEGLP